MSCACLFGSSALVVFCFPLSLPHVLLPSSCGSFLLGGPSSSSSVGGFGPGTFFVLLWFSLRLFSLVCRLLSSRFPLPSSGSSLVLVWLPSLPSFSILFLPWLGSFSLRQFSLACAGVLLSPLLWFLSHHLGFLFFLGSFSGLCFLPSLGFVLVLFFFFNILRDSVASRFLRDGVLPLGRVFSVSCGCCSFSVCFFSWPSFSVRPGSSSLVASSPLVSGPSGDCSSVPFPSEGYTLPTFLPWFPPDPPCASPLCVESVGRLPVPSVLRLWLASLSAAVAPSPEGPFLTGSQSLGLGVLAVVSWRLVPLFRGWFLSCCTWTSHCLSLFLLGCFVPLSAMCHSLCPPCSLFLLVLCGLLTSFIWAFSSFLSSSSLVSVSCVFLLWGPPSDPLSLVSLSLRVFTRQVLFLLSLVASRWVGDLQALVAGIFLGGCPVLLSFPGFGRCLGLPFILSFALFCYGLFGILWALLRLSSSCVPFGLFGCASIVLLLFLPVLVPSFSTLSFSLPFSGYLQFLLPCCPGRSNFFS